MMPSAASPQSDEVRIFGAPTLFARSLASRKIRFESNSMASPTPPSERASLLMSSAEEFPPNVTIERSASKAFANSAATSTARLAPADPSVATMMRCIDIASTPFGARRTFLPRRFVLLVWIGGLKDAVRPDRRSPRAHSSLIKLAASNMATPSRSTSAIPFETQTGGPNRSLNATRLIRAVYQIE